MVGIPNGPKCRVDVELLVLVPGTGRSRSTVRRLLFPPRPVGV